MLYILYHILSSVSSTPNYMYPTLPTFYPLLYTFPLHLPLSDKAQFRLNRLRAQPMQHPCSTSLVTLVSWS